MIQIQQITLQRGTKVLLDKADLMIQAQQKIGIVGANGVGKSSLFQVLQDELTLEHGTINLPGQLNIAHMQQEVPTTQEAAIDYVMQGDKELTAINLALQKAEQANDGMALAKLHERMAEIDAYTARSRAAKIMCGLGFQQAQLEQAVNAFSGGWRVRLNLAKVLLSRADLLLLDEPTNHLDLEAIIWLEEWLRQIPATLLIISHDREFLDHVVSHIVHVKNQNLKLYVGNYSQFEEHYAMDLALQQKAYVKQQRQRAHMQAFVDRFRYKASKAKQAQSRLKMLERMQKVAAISEEGLFSFAFKTAPTGEDPMLTLNDASIGYENQLILQDINLSLNQGDRIGLLGMNGTGKSTLIKVLANELVIKAGEKFKSNKIKIGYFAQYQVEELALNKSPIQHLRAIDLAISDKEARAYLGSFDFRNDRVFEVIENFSGGEKTRLALALIIWQQPNILLLDEPTNHLDMEMRTALARALQDYQGAMVLVSHDRHLLQSLVDEFWLVAKGSVQRFDGDLGDYQAWVQQQNKLEEKKVTTKANKQAPEKPKVKKSSASNLQKQYEKAEKKLIKLKEKQQGLQLQLADHALYTESANKDLLRNLLAEEKQLQQTIAACEGEILTFLI